MFQNCSKRRITPGKTNSKARTSSLANSNAKKKDSDHFKVKQESTSSNPVPSSHLMTGSHTSLLTTMKIEPGLLSPQDPITTINPRDLFPRPLMLPQHLVNNTKLGNKKAEVRVRADSEILARPGSNSANILTSNAKSPASAARAGVNSLKGASNKVCSANMASSVLNKRSSATSSTSVSSSTSLTSSTATTTGPAATGDKVSRLF